MKTKVSQLNRFNLNLTDQQRAQEQILELLPMINEMNAVSEELNKYRKFDLVLMSGIQQEDSDKSTK